MTEPVPDAGPELEEVVADWKATSGLTPSREASLVVARVEAGQDLDLDASRLPRDAVLLVVTRVRDAHDESAALRVLRGWKASSRGLRLVQFDDLAAEEGGSWWRLAYRPSADAHGERAFEG